MLTSRLTSQDLPWTNTTHSHLPLGIRQFHICIPSYFTYAASNPFTRAQNLHKHICIQRVQMWEFQRNLHSTHKNRSNMQSKWISKRIFGIRDYNSSWAKRTFDFFLKPFQMLRVLTARASQICLPWSSCHGNTLDNSKRNQLWRYRK
jgi:hypothetical protein